MQRIFRECLEGNGLKSIARSLNADGIASRTGKKWGATSIEKILHNEAYSGTLVWGKRTKTPSRVGSSRVPLRIKDAWPALIDQATFVKAQSRLAARAPQVTYPREVDSPYLLSGTIHCRMCGAAMIGHGTGASRYRYYICGSAHRKGREVCPLPMLPKDKAERFIIDRIKNCILTEENLEELVRLTNEELCQSCSENRERLELIQAQIEELDSRLCKLYDALETGDFKSMELSPRIKALSQRKEELLKAKTEVEEILRYKILDIADPQLVRNYASDLRNLLATSSITEERSFLKSFIERIEVDESQVKMYYTIPMPPHSVSEETVGVLPFVHNG